MNSNLQSVAPDAPLRLSTEANVARDPAKHQSARHPDHLQGTAAAIGQKGGAELRLGFVEVDAAAAFVASLAACRS